jgi:hypothetical protein
VATASDGKTPALPTPQVNQLMLGFQASQVAATLLRLGIDDILAHGSSPVAEVARATGVGADALARLLRGAAALGLVRETERDRFELTAAGADLHAHRDMALWCADPTLYLVHSRMADAVRSGRSAARDVLGVDLWQHLGSHPEEQATFDRAMATLTEGEAAAIVRTYGLSRFHRIVDVGGGRGATLSALLHAAPQASSVLLDQPHVIEQAAETFAVEGLSDRVELVGGSFLESVPPGGDLYVVKQVIHNWDDEGARLILRRCAEAAPAGATLLVVEIVLPDDLEPSFVHLLDLLMLVAFGGRERTVEQHRALLHDAGWKLDGVSPAPVPGLPLTLLESHKIR